MEEPKQPKKTMGKRRIEMKRIEKKSTLQVTFSKRRIGLFKKASELSVLCGSQIAILVQSPSQKMLAFGNPSVDSTIQRFLIMNSNNDGQMMSMQCLGEDSDSFVKRLEYTEAVNKLESEKKVLCNNKQEHGLWIDKSIERMGLDEIEEYLQQLKGLSGNVQHRLVEINNQNIIDQQPQICTGTLVGDCNKVVQQRCSDEMNKLSQESVEVVRSGSLSSSSNSMARDNIERLGDDKENIDSFIASLLQNDDDEMSDFSQLLNQSLLY